MEIQNKSFNHFVLFFIVLFVAGCEKEDYTLPVDLRMHFSITEAPVINGLISIETIAINLNSIDISGYREMGDDIFFKREFDDSRQFLLKVPEVSETLLFQIPQGVYNPLFFSLNFSPADEDEDDLIEDIESWREDVEEDDDDFQDLQEELGDIIEDYFDDTEPCFLLSGTYRNNEEVYHLYLAINDPLIFKVKAVNNDGNQEVVLDKNVINKARLVMNPAYWFSVISPSTMNKASVGILENRKYIFIHKHLNEDIYTSVVNRIEESTEVIIND